MSIILSKLQYAHWGYAGICRQLHHLKAGHFMRILLSKAKTKFRKSANHLKACEFNYHMMPVCLKAEYMIKDLIWVWDHDFGFLLWVQVSSKAPSGPGWSSTSQNVPKEKYTRLEASVQYANRFPSLERPRSLLERPRSAMRGLWREKKWTHGTIT